MNIDTGEVFYCRESAWTNAREQALIHGWEPEGTLYDFEFALNEQWDDLIGYDFNLFIMIQLHDERIRWNGNYTDKKDQIVLDNDSYNLYCALKNSGCEEKLIGFIRKGGFRIRSV